jgi:hypothetical protein
LTKSLTLLPVAILILIILGVVHLYWLMFVGMAIYGILGLEGMLNTLALSFTLVPILSIPLAYFIENLRPKRTVIYCLSALAPAIVFYGYGLLQPGLGPGENFAVLLGITPIFLGLPIATFVLRQLRRKKVPNKSLEQPGNE